MTIMKQSRKHSLSPELSPNPGRYPEEEEEEHVLERSIKKLKLDSDNHANVPFSRPLNKRFPSHVEGPDDPYYMHDINFPAVNKVLNELAIIREFREKVRNLRESKTMHTISEHTSYDYPEREGLAWSSSLYPPPLPPQADLKFALSDTEEECHHSSSGGDGSSSHTPMETE